MKLQDVFEQEVEQIVQTMRDRRKNRAKQARSELKYIRRKNNPKPNDDPQMSYDGDGDMSGDAITNIQKGG